LKANGFRSIWLDASFEHCWLNITFSRKERPLARDKNKARALFEERQKVYCLADFHFVVKADLTSVRGRENDLERDVFVTPAACSSAAPSATIKPRNIFATAVHVAGHTPPDGNDLYLMTDQGGRMKLKLFTVLIMMAALTRGRMRQERRGSREGSDRQAGRR
jgi:hypothetical protein